jgi:hypothetical protein
MYVCLKCNHPVDQPKKRWWSQWRYCPHGHILYVRGLGSSREQTFGKSFVKGFIFSLIVCLWILGVLAIDAEAHDRPVLKSVAALLEICAAMFYSAWGLMLLAKVHRWQGQDGAVRLLVPNVKGRAWGFLASVACQLVVMAMLLSLIK